ncbi:MAG: N-formylglutamate amidohydrolase [Alphaproteobacteria bacterium]|nr:N-formylglutamate amidohydrolase [Alphaproteobacteria bacterium]
MTDPPAVSVVNAGSTSPIVLICEHASRFIPARFANLGLPPEELQRHIAWDIGAAAVARHIAAALDTVLILAGYSRLLIDCNRPLSSPTSIPERSEATDIPGNVGLSAGARAERDALFFAPFRARVAAELEARLAARRPAVLIGMHSFTPVFLGVPRPWHAGVLYARAQRLAARLLEGLRADDSLVVGENEPYRITTQGDFTVPVQGDARGIPTALFEVRQDLIADAAGAAAWGARLAGVLARVAEDPGAVQELS